MFWLIFSRQMEAASIRLQCPEDTAHRPCAFVEDKDVRCLHYILNDKPWKQPRGTGGDYETVNAWWWDRYDELQVKIKETNPESWKFIEAEVMKVWYPGLWIFPNYLRAHLAPNPSIQKWKLLCKYKIAFCLKRTIQVRPVLTLKTVLICEAQCQSRCCEGDTMTWPLLFSEILRKGELIGYEHTSRLAQWLPLSL